MSHQTPTLLPSLFALQSPTSLPLLLARLSLQALHVQTYSSRDDIYTATSSVIPGQMRSLRLRAERIMIDTTKFKGKGKARAEVEPGYIEEGEEGWEYTLTYTSPPMNGREYSEMSVRVCIGLEVVGGSKRKEIEGFIEVLGFKHSHSYTRTGYLVHLPLPVPNPTPLTLHLIITRMKPLGDSSKPETNVGPSSEPFLLTLQPSRPVLAVSISGEIGLESMMGVIRDTADRIEGVDWETGRM